MIKLGSIVFLSFFAFTYSAIAQEDVELCDCMEEVTATMKKARDNGYETQDSLSLLYSIRLYWGNPCRQYQTTSLHMYRGNSTPNIVPGSSADTLLMEDFKKKREMCPTHKSWRNEWGLYKKWKDSDKEKIKRLSRNLNIERAVQKGEGAYGHQLSIGTNLWSIFAWPGLNLDYILNGKYGLTVGAEKQWISDFSVGDTPGEGVIVTTKEWKGHRINAEVRYYWSEELDHYPEYFIGAYYRYRYSVKNEFSKNTSEYESTGVYTGNPNDYFTHNAKQFITGHYAGITFGVMFGKIKLGAGIGLPVYFRDVLKESEFHSANPDHPEYTIQNQGTGMRSIHIKLDINLSIPVLKQGYISFDR